MNASVPDWADVPYDPSNFSAKAPLAWRVGEKSVVTYAYRVHGKTMTLAFKIEFSTLEGRPSNELHLRIPGSRLPAREMGNPIWIGSPTIKECAYVTVHPGDAVAVLFRQREETFPIEAGYFFLYGQLTFSVQ